MKRIHIWMILAAFCAVSCSADAINARRPGPACAGAVGGSCDDNQICEDGTCKDAGEACSEATSNHNGYGYCLPGFGCVDGNCKLLCGSKTCENGDICCDYGNGPECLNTSERGLASCTSCIAGYDDCDGNWSNGCESLSDSVNCGSCGTPCDGSCESGQCSTGGCSGSETACNTGIATVCVDLAATHMQSCSSCESGYANCDGDLSNGCEADTQTSVAHCGSCGSPCEAPSVCTGGLCLKTCDAAHKCSDNGAEYCIDSSIHVEACGKCTAGFDNCDGNWVNGCEVDLKQDDAHCGSCTNDCNGQTCVNSQCVAPCIGSEVRCTSEDSTYCMNAGVHHMSGCDVCAHGYDNCNGDWSDGCETVLGTRNQCSRCGDVCDADKVCSELSCSDDCAGSELKCTEDGLAFCVNADARHLSDCDTCTQNYANCNGTFTDGCEVDLAALHQTDCEQCADGFANCDGSWTNGCEVDLVASHLAECGTCIDDYCLVGGTCVTNDSTKACGASCMNCEAMPYTTESSCFEGTCIAETCEDGYEYCNGLCVDLKNNKYNCGACGVKCNGSCSGGVCSGGDPIKTCGAIGGVGCNLPEMCCANLETGETGCRAEGGPGFNCFTIDNSDCGLRHKDCNKEPNAKTGVCTGGGLCQITECQYAFHLTKLDPGNACVGNKNVDCGPVDGTGVSCMSYHGATDGICTKGYCVAQSCESGKKLCNSICADLQTDRYNCGICGRICENADCVNGQCASYHDGCGAVNGSGCGSAVEQCCTNLVSGEISCSTNTMTAGYQCVNMYDYLCGSERVNCTHLPHAVSTKCMGGSTCQILSCDKGFHVNDNRPGNECVSD